VPACCVPACVPGVLCLSPCCACLPRSWWFGRWGGGGGFRSGPAISFGVTRLSLPLVCKPLVVSGCFTMRATLFLLLGVWLVLGAASTALAQDGGGDTHYDYFYFVRCGAAGLGLQSWQRSRSSPAAFSRFQNRGPLPPQAVAGLLLQRPRVQASPAPQVSRRPLARAPRRMQITWVQSTRAAPIPHSERWRPALQEPVHHPRPVARAGGWHLARVLRPGQPPEGPQHLGPHPRPGKGERMAGPQGRAAFPGPRLPPPSPPPSPHPGRACLTPPPCTQHRM
jgi:hypothetical protein